MYYFKITYSNGYCGCDEEEYIEAESEEEAWQVFLDGIEGYSFTEPDSRFVDQDDYETEEEYFEAYEEYQDGIQEYSTLEKISEEEYKKNC